MWDWCRSNLSNSFVRSSQSFLSVIIAIPYHLAYWHNVKSLEASLVDLWLRLHFYKVRLPPPVVLSAKARGLHRLRKFIEDFKDREMMCAFVTDSSRPRTAPVLFVSVLLRRRNGGHARALRFCASLTWSKSIGVNGDFPPSPPSVPFLWVLIFRFFFPHNEMQSKKIEAKVMSGGWLSLTDEFERSTGEEQAKQRAASFNVTKASMKSPRAQVGAFHSWRLRQHGEANGKTRTIEMSHV